MQPAAELRLAVALNHETQSRDPFEFATLCRRL
jgi:hypothetical protein